MSQVVTQEMSQLPIGWLQHVPRQANHQRQNSENQDGRPEADEMTQEMSQLPIGWLKANMAATLETSQLSIGWLKAHMAPTLEASQLSIGWLQLVPWHASYQR